jgi:tetratricopeptide (TPR) repeat protein
MGALTLHNLQSASFNLKSLARAGLCLIVVAVCAGVQALQDIPLTGLNPSAVESAPLDAKQRATLQDALKSRDYTRAETLLLDEINRNPKSPQLLTLAGRVFFLDGKYLNTAIAMKKAETLAPLDERSRFTLAMAYITLNHRGWARPELEKLEQSNPRNALYPYWISRLDYDAQKFSAAVTSARKAIELDASFMKAYDNLGLSYEALGQYDNAVASYQEALRLNRSKPPSSPWPLLNLGTLLVKLGRLDEAETYLKEALQIDAKFPQGHCQMGLLLEKRGKDAEAIHELEQAAELNPRYAEPYYVLGKIYRRQGDEKDAEKARNQFQKLKSEETKESPR